MQISLNSAFCSLQLGQSKILRLKFAASPFVQLEFLLKADLHCIFLN